jgi:hypothetical protein
VKIALRKRAPDNGGILITYMRIRRHFREEEESVTVAVV